MLLLTQRAPTDCVRVATHRVTGRRVPTGADDDAHESHDEVEEDENEVDDLKRQDGHNAVVTLAQEATAERIKL